MLQKRFLNKNFTDKIKCGNVTEEKLRNIKKYDQLFFRTLILARTWWLKKSQSNNRPL